jgi:transposase-like protein
LAARKAIRGPKGQGNQQLISAAPAQTCPLTANSGLVFSLAKRWLMGTHHGAVSEKHLPAYLDEYVFRFNRRTAKRISHGFARLIEQAVRTGPSTYQAIVATPA